MLNVEELRVPELRLAMCHVKEAMRVILHTILLNRSIGGHRPIEAQIAYSEQFELSYVKSDEQVLEQTLEVQVQKFGQYFEKNLSKSNSKAVLLLSFYTTKNRKASLWNMLAGTEEKIIFEQWRIPVSVQPLRRYSNPAENLREEAQQQSLASQQTHSALLYILGGINTKLDHLPPPPQSQAVYKFDISFSSQDSLGAGSELAWSPRALSQNIRKIPYIT